ncbi:hypothetical protein LTR36_000795 [Oleoguttula mirabilis]|uniref:Uncharacterized protein n=1 Tax=Oleoguttula mirabilis TaxID=1507867 RepID=A0AAV9J350_9PEZI|nr:hypothetical protein LTR36_000795 [Oleoguttula mirabilis]
MVFVTTNGDAAIAGLREQILANAVVLFRSIVSNHKNDLKLKSSEPRPPPPTTKPIGSKYSPTKPSTSTALKTKTPYNPKTNTDYVPASEAFDLLVLKESAPTTEYCAVLAYQSDGQDKAAARGESKATVSEALGSLLDVTATQLRNVMGVGKACDCGLSAGPGDGATVHETSVHGKSGVVTEESKA